jgi:excisionase family DNA binding protein
MPKILTIGEAAKRLGLETDTVRKLESAGKIQAVRTNGGHRRFTEAELDRFQKSRRGRGKTTQKRNPSTGEFAGHEAAFANDPDEFDEGLSIEDVDAEEQASYRPPPPPRPNPVAPPAPFVPQPLPSLFDPADTERLRLRNIRIMGQGAIPSGTPAEWYRQVIVDLERYVTTSQFPAELPAFKALELVMDRVKTVLRPWRETKEKAERAKEAKQASERLRNSLISKGNEYARRETTDWDIADKFEAWDEVRKGLQRDVGADWTDREVESLVDEVLEGWDDDEDEADDEDGDDGED